MADLFQYGIAFYALAALVVVAVGISKSGFGAGVEMMAVPVLSLMIAPQVAAAVMLPILMAMDLANFWRYRRHWVRRIIYLLIPAAIVGISVGALSFKYLNGEIIKLGIGILALAFVAQRYLAPERLSVPKPVLLVLGGLGGFTSFVAHAGSAPIKMALLAEDLPKQEFVGTNSYLFGTINLIKVIPYFWLGQFSAQNLTTSATLAPFVVLGVGLGFYLNKRVSQLLFTRIIFAVLFLAGLKLVYDGLIALS
ncbi:MAG: sulfite exporter TauE/SafE family protein [Pseudomonadota bacterium]